MTIVDNLPDLIATGKLSAEKMAQGVVGRHLDVERFDGDPSPRRAEPTT